RFDGGLAAPIIEVYVAAISAMDSREDGVTVGSHTLVTCFLKGAQRLSPLQRSPVLSWDLPIVLKALCQSPFEPLERVGLKWLSMKTAFLLAMASAKRRPSQECLYWNPGGTGVTCGRIRPFFQRGFIILHKPAPQSGCF